MNAKDRPLFSKAPITKEDHAKLKNIFEALESDPQAYDFLEPVDYVGLGLADYPAIIKTPMDFSTIKQNLKNGKYSNLQEVFADVQLIWDNCKLYNMKGSDIYKMAIHCEKVVKKLVEKNFRDSAIKNKSGGKKSPDTKAEGNQDQVTDNDESPSNEALSMLEKMNVTEKIRKLSNEGLAAVYIIFPMVQKECPQAFEELDSEKVQLKIDQIDRKTYDQAISLIESLMKGKETPAANQSQSQSQTQSQTQSSLGKKLKIENSS